MSKSKRVSLWIGSGLAFIGLAVGLAWVSPGFGSAAGWGSFLAVLVLMALLTAAAWRSLRGESPPRWLLGLVIGAALLRLAVGVFWVVALPEWGSDNDQQRAGYIMTDPYERDADAWELAGSEEPLLAAFQEYSPYDQYGGLLFFSAAVYRYLGPEIHQPLLIVAVTAPAAALAALYLWDFSRRAWGEKTAGLAAWMIAVYPDAVLQGSSQMREAFMMPLALAAVYLLHRFWEDPWWRGGVGLAALLAVSAALSFPFAGLLLILLMMLSFVWGRAVIFPQVISWRSGLIVLASLAVLAGVAVLSLDWIQHASWFQSYITEKSSGIVQVMFEVMPEALQIPFVVAYGMVRPLLPAALVYSGSNVFGQAIAIWRSLGWTVALALILYASFLSIRTKAWYKLPGVILFFNWIVIATASFRGGGDDWDNPRYRVPFAGMQLAMAAWALAQQRERKDPWLRRLVVISGLMVFWVVIWYLPRYTALPYWLGRPFDAVGLGAFSGALYLVWEWVGGE